MVIVPRSPSITRPHPARPAGARNHRGSGRPGGVPVRVADTGAEQPVRETEKHPAGDAEFTYHNASFHRVVAFSAVLVPRPSG